MKIKSVSISWPRAAVLMWASVWMLAAPLFHVHPDADHRHGEEGHVHGGTVHMVWSPDLDCESDSDRHVDPTERTAHNGISNGAQFAHVGDRHAEFGLSLLNDTTDRKSFKPFWAPVLGSSPADVSGIVRSVRVQRSANVGLSQMPFVRAISTRAPPSLLV
jgi:hypothetical protein